MATDPNTPLDGDSLATAVRALAADARRVLAGRGQGGVDPLAIRELSRRVALLQREMRGRVPDEIRRWLESLGRQVEAIGRRDAWAARAA